MLDIILGRLNGPAPFAPPIAQTTPLARVLSPALGALLAAMGRVKIRIIRLESISPQRRRIHHALDTEEIQAQSFFREDFFLGNAFAVDWTAPWKEQETRYKSHHLRFFLDYNMPAAPKNRRSRRFLGPQTRHLQLAEATQQHAGGVSVYQGPDWPSFVITPQGPENPGGWNTANGWNHPGESSNVQVS
ncbi:hypothetical protein B0H13DRAFT_2332013 [Mycena leptocephala]|nr:hypothetical protein B0H13DRAFT_2332013 [Mycena leptocephala]